MVFPEHTQKNRAGQLEHDEIRLSWRRIGDRPFLPLPALRGERVGVRGSFGKSNSRRVPLTRRSPDDALHRRESADLSPHPPSPEGGLQRTRAGRGDRTRASSDSTKSHHALASLFPQLRPIIQPLADLALEATIGRIVKGLASQRVRKIVLARESFRRIMIVFVA